MSFANYDYDAEAQRTVNPSTRKTIAEASPILNEVSNELTAFTADITRLNKLQRQLGTKRDTAELRQQIDEIIKQCNTIHSEMDQSLDALTQKGEESQDPKLSFTGQKLRAECQDVYKNYQTILRSYNEKIQSVTVNEQYKKNEMEKKQLEQNQKQLEQQTESTPLVGNEDASYDAAQQAIQVQRQELSEAEVAYQSDLIEQRDEAITNISKSVQDVNKIFKDLNEIVNQQGEQIDTVEDNMNDYANNNQRATEELNKANEYQKKRSKWSCLFLVALIVILLIVLAILS